MMKLFKLASSDDVMDVKNPFCEMIGQKDDVYEIKNVGLNYIVFMVSGEVEVINNKSVVTTMSPNNIYSLCVLCSPFSFKANTDFKCIVLLADTLVSHVNATRLRKVMSANIAICEGLPHLSYNSNSPIESLVQNILLLNDCREVMPDGFYDIKKSEFLHYMVLMYPYEDIATFIYGIVSTYSGFKRSVYSSYKNSINVEKMAESMFMTTKTLTRNFKKEFNMTPNDWILEQRLSNINHYISNKGMPLHKLLEEFDFSTFSALKQFLIRHDETHLLDKIIHQDK